MEYGNIGWHTRTYGQKYTDLTKTSKSVFYASTNKGKGNPQTCLRRHKEEAEIFARRVANSLGPRVTLRSGQVQAWKFRAKTTPRISPWNGGLYIPDNKG